MSPDFQLVIDRLESGRLRGFLGIGVEALTSGVLASAAGFTVATLLQRWTGAGPAPAVAAAAAALVTAAVVFALRALLDPPALDRLSERADRVFGLDERVSTALELERGKRSAIGPVGRELLRETASRAAAIDPRRLSPIGLPRWWPVVLVLAGLALAVLLLPHGEEGAGPTPVADAPLAAAERESAAEDLHRIAELIEQDAERTADPYLGAVARTIEDLATRLDEGLERAPTIGEVNRLAELAREAYAQAGPAVRDSQLPDLLESIGEGLAGERQTPAALPEVAPPMQAPKEELGAPPPDAPMGEGAAPGEPGGRPLETADMEGGQRPMADDSYPEPDVATPEREFVLSGQRLVGGAQDANRGAGNMAGVGVQALGENGEVLLDTSALEMTDVALPGEPDPRGRLVKVDVTPTAELSEVGAGTAIRGPWRAAPVGEVARDPVAPPYLDTVARYFGYEP